MLTTYVTQAAHACSDVKSKLSNHPPVVTSEKRKVRSPEKPDSHKIFPKIRSIDSSDVPTARQRLLQRSKTSPALAPTQSHRQRAHAPLLKRLSTPIGLRFGAAETEPSNRSRLYTAPAISTVVHQPSSYIKGRLGGTGDHTLHGEQVKEVLRALDALAKTRGHEVAVWNDCCRIGFFVVMCSNTSAALVVSVLQWDVADYVVRKS